MLGSSEVIIVVVVILLLFGSSQIPKMAKNLGKAQKEFRESFAEANSDGTVADAGKSADTTSTKQDSSSDGSSAS